MIHNNLKYKIHNNQLLWEEVIHNLWDIRSKFGRYVKDTHIEKIRDSQLRGLSTYDKRFVFFMLLLFMHNLFTGA